MMRPQIRYIFLFAVLLLVWLGVHCASREPVESEPRLITGSPVRQVLDLLTPPTGISGTADAKPIEIPGDPTRYLVVSIADGKIAIGWSTDPSIAPTESAYLPTTGSFVKSWIAKEDHHLVVVKAATSNASDIIVTAIELHLQP